MAQNETLSPKQAKQIIKQYDNIINATVRKIQSGFETFFDTMKNEWEDQYAIDLAKKLEASMKEVTTHLDTNCKAFSDTVEAIAKAYATTGGMAAIALGVISPVTLVLNPAVIKDTFDGDLFGFKNVNSSDKVTEALGKLEKTLQESISEANSQLRSINAFGNTTVMQNLAVSSGRIIEILQGAVGDVEKFATTNINAAAQAYQSTGSSAESAADIQKG